MPWRVIFSLLPLEVTGNSSSTDTGSACALTFVGNKLVSKLHGVWYFVMAAWMDSGSGAYKNPCWLVLQRVVVHLSLCGLSQGRGPGLSSRASHLDWCHLISWGWLWMDCASVYIQTGKDGEQGTEAGGRDSNPSNFSFSWKRMGMDRSPDAYYSSNHFETDLIWAWQAAPRSFHHLHSADEDGEVTWVIGGHILIRDQAYANWICNWGKQLEQ